MKKNGGLQHTRLNCATCKINGVILYVRTNKIFFRISNWKISDCRCLLPVEGCIQTSFLYIIISKAEANCIMGLTITDFSHLSHTFFAGLTYESCTSQKL